MASTPLITFKAGRCDVTGRKIKPIATPGYLYLYSEDELVHLCWRPRSAPAAEPEIDLITIPGDATFSPLVKQEGAEEVRSPTNGRVFVLRFSSSGEKQYFWMQAKSQHSGGDADFFSLRDQRLGQIVDSLLAGEEVDVAQEVAEIRQGGGAGAGGEDEGDAAEDLMELDRQETGGAGQDATGGDPRDEGEASREGGADGGRATSSTTLPPDANTAVQNFLNSLKSSGGSSQQQQQQQQPYTTLPDLLTPGTTIPYIDTLTPTALNNLCAYLPADLFLLAQESDTSTTSPADATPADAQAAIDALSAEQKKDILKRVLRSPQLQQSLASLTVALRDGGLPMIGEALGLRMRNGGFVQGGSSMPLGGGEAVRGFVEGVKGSVEEEGKEEEGGGEKKD